MLHKNNHYIDFITIFLNETAEQWTLVSITSSKYSLVSKHSLVEATCNGLLSITCCLYKRMFGDKGVFLFARCPSCHPTNSVKKVKETQSTYPNRSPGLILSLSTWGMRRIGVTHFITATSRN